MKKKVLAFLFIVAFFSTSFLKSGQLMAHVDKMYYLQGKIGEQSIYLKIKCYDEFPTRYLNCFFEEDKMDQFFKGTLVAGTWKFISNDNPNKKRSLDIKEGQKGIWKGSYTDSNGKKTIISLTPLLKDPNAKYYPFSQEKKLDPYEACKISKVKLLKTETKNISKDFSLDWFKEKESGIAMFRVQSENKKIILDSLNNVLEDLQLSYIYDYYFLDESRKELTVNSEILYLNEALISFKIISNTTFKTKKPLKAQQILSLDISTGKQLDLENLLWLDKKAPKPEDDNLTAIYEYRKKIFAPFVFSTLSNLYPEKMKNSGCGLDKESIWALPNFAITKDGLSLFFSHSTVCNNIEWAVISFAKLAPYLDDKYKLTEQNAVRF